MQTLQHQHGQGSDFAQPQDHPMMRGLLADQTTAYADEVRVLRQRVAALEAELATAKASQLAATAAGPRPVALTSIDPAPAAAPAPASVFTEQLIPAVAAVLPAAPSTQQLPGAVAESTPAQAEQAEAMPAQPMPAQPMPAQPMPAQPTLGDSPADPGFAQAWTTLDDDPSFEERVAERAFFQASTVDSESRSWLLDE